MQGITLFSLLASHRFVVSELLLFPSWRGGWRAGSPPLWLIPGLALSCVYSLLLYLKPQMTASYVSAV